MSSTVSHLAKQLVIQMFSVGWRRPRRRSIAHSRQSVFERRWHVYGSDLWRSVNKSPVVDPLDWTQSAKLCRLKLIENVSSAVRALAGCVSAPNINWSENIKRR